MRRTRGGVAKWKRMSIRIAVVPSGHRPPCPGVGRTDSSNFNSCRINPRYIAELESGGGAVSEQVGKKKDSCLLRIPPCGDPCQPALGVKITTKFRSREFASTSKVSLRSLKPAFRFLLVKARGCDGSDSRRKTRRAEKAEKIDYAKIAIFMCRGNLDFGVRWSGEAGCRRPGQRKC